MARRQRQELIATGIEERVGAHEERVGVMLREARERSVDLGFGIGLIDLELQPPRARSFLHHSYHALGVHTARID